MPSDARKLLANLDALSQQGPDPQDSASAIAAARQALQARRTRQRGRAWLRVIVSAGVAASLVLTGNLFLDRRHEPAFNAPVEFRAAAAQAGAYQGWVEVVATPRDGMMVAGKGRLLKVTCRASSAEAAFGEIRQYENGTELLFGSRGVQESYLVGSGEIHRQIRAWDRDAVAPADLQLPGALEGLLRRVESAGQSAGIAGAREGNDIRLDVTLFRTQAEEGAFNAKNFSAARVPAKVSIWLDAKKVMTRISWESMGQVMDGEIHYAALPVASIYDLGAPREARVMRTEEHEGERPEGHPEVNDRH